MGGRPSLKTLATDEKINEEVKHKGDESDSCNIQQVKIGKSCVKRVSIMESDTVSSVNTIGINPIPEDNTGNQPKNFEDRKDLNNSEKVSEELNKNNLNIIDNITNTKIEQKSERVKPKRGRSSLKTLAIDEKINEVKHKSDESDSCNIQQVKIGKTCVQRVSIMESDTVSSVNTIGINPIPEDNTGNQPKNFEDRKDLNNSEKVNEELNKNNLNIIDNITNTKIELKSERVKLKRGRPSLKTLATDEKINEEVKHKGDESDSCNIQQVKIGKSCVKRVSIIETIQFL